MNFQAFICYFLLKRNQIHQEGILQEEHLYFFLQIQIKILIFSYFFIDLILINFFYYLSLIW